MVPLQVADSLELTLKLGVLSVIVPVGLPLLAVGGVVSGPPH
jgi:hypothetical protein